MAGAGDLEEDLVLALQLDFAVIQAAGEKHRAVKTNEGVAVEPAKFDCVQLCHFDASLHRHSVALVLRWTLVEKWSRQAVESQLYRKPFRLCEWAPHPFPAG